MRHLTRFIVCLSIGQAAAQPLASSASASPTVTNPSTGVTFEGNLSSGIESFFNIRFGEDTSGANRFALPVAFEYPPKTVVNASTFGADCPQAVTTGLFATEITTMSEDCLTLRIDRLENTTADAKLPVMIWLFGGGFTSGTIYESSYDPTGLLKTAQANGSPVIFAALNYRLNLFGFAASPALNDSLNAGLYDQRLGMKWIKDNIHLFGGDANNITMFGQSAGAISIGHHINAFGGEKPIYFHRAIMESGMSTTVAGTTGNVSDIHTQGIAEKVNCTSPNSEMQLECLRAVPLSTLLPIVSKYELSINPNALTIWQPIAPSRFIPHAPSKLVQSGRFHKNIDIINGWNENDGTVFIEPTFANDTAAVEAVTHPASLDSATSSELLSLYPISAFAPVTDGNETATAYFFQAAQMWRDFQFTCPALLLDQAMANHSTASTKMYLYAMNTTLFATQFQKANESFLGVVHGSEVPFAFDTVSAYATATTAQTQLGSAMSASWSAFASSGNAALGSVALKGWTESFQKKASAFEVMILGGPNNGMTSISAGGQGVLESEDLIQRCAFWNSENVLNQMQT